MAFEGLEGEQLDRAKDLADWWRQMADDEINVVVPKAIEYGSADLAVMGRAMVMLLPRTGKVDPSGGQEMACAFYCLGKVARLFGAYEQGALTSDDTWVDLGIYCRMAQRIRETGRWG